MDECHILLIVKCAFQICYYYLLNCFTCVPIKMGSCINVSMGNNYNSDLICVITKLKKLLSKICISDDYPCGSIPDYSCDTNTSDHHTGDYDICSNDSPNGYINKEKKIIKKIKKNITEQLKNKYGDDVCIEFQYDNNVCNNDSDDNNNNGKAMYSMKIKDMGKHEPDKDDYKLSEIYVSTKNKKFYVKTRNGFECYPLAKKSLVRCDKL